MIPFYRARACTTTALIKGILTIDPRRRMTLDDVASHPWCHRYAPYPPSTLSLLPPPSSLSFSDFSFRPSQLAGQGALQLAERLTASLRATGDLEIATPAAVQSSAAVDADGDQLMSTAPEAGSAHQSQFTQSLMLFVSNLSLPSMPSSLTCHRVLTAVPRDLFTFFSCRAKRKEAGDTPRT
jgi:serine/threonine-protein kinase CHEK1